MPNALGPEIDQIDQMIVDEDTARAIYEEEQERERQLGLLAKAIEQKFTDDASQRTRKECEWYWVERLQLGSLFKQWGRWNSADNTDDPFSLPNSEYVNGDRPEFNIVKPKMKIGKAQLEMLQFGAGTDKNFTIKAKKPADMNALLTSQAPVFYGDGQTQMAGPDGQPMTVGQLAMQQSQADDTKARKMDEEVFKQLSNVKYGEKMRDGFDDLVWYGSVIYKGPFNNTKCKKIRMKSASSDGKPLWVSAYLEEAVPDFEKITPWLFYPDHRALCIDDAEHATVVHLYTPTQLRQLIKSDGFREEEITHLLQQKPLPEYYQQFRARAIQYNNAKYLENKYVVLEYHGTIGVDELGNLGIEPPYENPHNMYMAEIWVCQGRVIYASLELLEAGIKLPFAVNVWEKDPASMFGFGAIQLRDAQRVVNMSYQMILDNAGLIALPQAGIDKEGIRPIDGKPLIQPGKIWYKTEDGTGRSISDMMEFFFPPNSIEPLQGLLNMARQFGEEESIIPLIAGGLGDPQLGDTGATGMAMVMQAATSVLSSKAREWDDNITRPIVNWFYEWNMQYSEDDDIKGDYDIDVQTATAYLNKMMGQRDLERLCLEVAQNPELQDIIDVQEAYRARLAGMNIPYDSIVRTKEEVQQIQQQRAQNAQPDPASIKAQADMVNAQARMEDTKNDAAKMQFDAQQGMQMAELKHQEVMMNNQTRNNEATARAIDAASRRDVAMAALAADDKQAADKMAVDLQIHQDQQNESAFIQGIQAQQAHRKLDLEERNVATKEEELKIKRQTGSGI